MNKLATDLAETDRLITRTLSQIDWNFRGSTTPPGSIHALNWYPGNFIPQIPSFLIELLSKEGDLVADTFCGSGTVGVEALRLGRATVLGDVNPVAVRVAKGKLAIACTPKLHVQLDAWMSDVGLLGLEGKATRPASTGDRALAEWLHPETLGQLTLVWNEITDTADENVKAALEMIFSDTLFTCLSTSASLTASGGLRRHHWGWVADNVVPKHPPIHPALRIFADKVATAQLASRLEFAEPVGRHQIFQADARATPLPMASVDLVVTSPPYVGMIDYTTAARIEYAWRGWSLEEDRKLEIGARSRRRNADVVLRYLEAIDQSFSEIARILKPNGFCAVVIGASRSFSTAAVDAIDLIGAKMPLFWGPVTRKASRRRISDRAGREFGEFVAVFRKGG